MLASVNSPLITSLSIAQSENQIAPAFTAAILPPVVVTQQEGLEDLAPDTLTVQFGDVTYTCQLSEQDISISADGIDIQAQYYPQSMVTLQTQGYGKHLVFLSCPQWQFDVYNGEYDTDDYLVLHKACDPYISTGWTINQIIAKIAELVDIQMVSLLPDFHVAQATIMLEKGQPYLQFITSLLPQGFTYAWHTYGDTLYLTLVQPTMTGFTLPNGFYQLRIRQSRVPVYNLVEITGGEYLPTAEIELGAGTFGLSVSTRAGAQTTETLDPDIKEVGDYEERTERSRVIQSGTDGELFAILSESQETTGPLFNPQGVYVGPGVIRRVEVTREYEHQNFKLYATPRQLKQTTVTSGYVTVLATGFADSTLGTVFYLTNGFEVIDRATYQANLLTYSGTVVLSAYTGWVDDYATTIETKTYTQSNEVTRDWIEGSERTNTVQETRRMYQINSAGVWYDCQESGDQILLAIAQTLSSAGSSFSNLSAQDRNAVTVSRKINVLSPKTYEFEETTSTLNSETGTLDVKTKTTNIDSQSIPSQPSQYKLKQLRASAGERGELNVVALRGNVATNNPKDFEVWAGMLYYHKTQTQQAASLEAFDKFIPPGGMIGGGTVVGFSVSVPDTREQTVTLELV